MTHTAKFLTAASLLGAIISMTPSASAKTASNTISVTATITNGSTVSVYITGDNSHGSVSNSLNGTPPVPRTVAPIVRIGFDSDRSFQLVKRVHWDKSHHQLTIDF